MKKTIALITLAVVVALALCLAGCGNSSATQSVSSSSVNTSSSTVKQDDAIVLNWKQAYQESLDNEARAKKNWDGKTVKWTATVFEIQSDCATCANETSKGYPLNSIDVYLSTDDLVKLNRGDEITVIGKLDWPTTSFANIMNASLVEE